MPSETGEGNVSWKGNRALWEAAFDLCVQMKVFGRGAPGTTSDTRARDAVDALFERQDLNLQGCRKFGAEALRKHVLWIVRQVVSQELGFSPELLSHDDIQQLANDGVPLSPFQLNVLTFQANRNAEKKLRRKSNPRRLSSSANGESDSEGEVDDGEDGAGEDGGEGGDASTPARSARKRARDVTSDALLDVSAAASASASKSARRHVQSTPAEDREQVYIQTIRQLQEVNEYLLRRVEALEAEVAEAKRAT